MNFVETLQGVGGVKPCPICYGTKEVDINTKSPARMVPCVDCHGTGRFFDLAPLLARPKELEACVKELKAEFCDAIPSDVWDTTTVSPMRADYVIGPQRAHALIYEVARQLGGTAVVARESYSPRVVEREWSGGRFIDRVEEGFWKDDGLCLSLLIPPNATVLFVTDRTDGDKGEQEIRAISRAAGVSATKVLPYLLSIIGGDKILTAECTCGGGVGSVSLRNISLHNVKE